ncbi:MAG: hypothetical protein JNK48_13470 [Bryobacterales bacterium]|nr:hypothetical protein [Bryobacterales bacterium]
MRILAFLMLCSTLLPAEWATPASAQDALRFIGARRAEAGKLWSSKDPKGIALLEDTIAYLRQPLLQDLAAGSKELAGQREEMKVDLAQAYALASQGEKAVQTLREVARALPAPEFARYIESRPAFRDIRSSADFQAMLKDFRRYEKFWDSTELAAGNLRELSEAERIAGLSKFWSEVKYNFGYPEKLMEVEWDRLYLEWIPKVQAARSTEDYYRRLKELCAKLKDGHTNIMSPPGVDEGKPPLRTALIAGRVMVMHVYSPSLEQQGITRGMEIVRVDGEPAVAFARRMYEPYQSSSTPGDRDMRVFGYDFLRGPSAQPARLLLRDGKGVEKELSVARSGYKDLRPIPPFEWKMLDNAIALVTLNTFGNEQTSRRFVEEFPKIRQAKAVILDLRWNGGGSSNIGYEVLRRFIDKPVLGSRQVMRRYVPTERAWGIQMDTIEFPATPIQPAAGEYFAGPVAVLTSPATYSAAEDFLVAWRNSGRGAVIGVNSGGSTGQPLFFTLPGGGSARVCTKKDTYPDGREWVGKGIEVDIPVAPDADALQAGKDNVLEAAIAHLLGKL